MSAYSYAQNYSKKIKINKQKNYIAIFSVPVSLQLCLKQQNKVSSI